MKIITVEVRGGNVQDVTNIPKGVAVSILDWDNIAVGDPKPKKGSFDYGGVPDPTHEKKLDAVARAIDAFNTIITGHGSTARSLITQAKEARMALLEAF